MYPQKKISRRWNVSTANRVFLSLSAQPSSGGAFDIDVKSTTRTIARHLSRPQSAWLSASTFIAHCGCERLTSSTTDTAARRLASDWFMKCKHKVNRKKAKRFEIVLHTSRTTFSRLSILARAYLRHTSVRGEQQLKITAQIKSNF